jgi:Sulfotransferase family
MPAQIFVTEEATPQLRNALADRAMERWPGAFHRSDEALDWLSHMITPVSEAWVYLGNAKSGTTSTKTFLFHLEFGAPVTVHFEPPRDINPDGIAHAMQRAGVFRSISNLPKGLKTLREALRLVTARHPSSRAVSSFRYLCLSDELASPWLLAERLRLNALTGFDWAVDRHTHRGFLKFLDYVEATSNQPGQLRDNPHIRPQVRNVRPDLYQPHLIGRTEDLPAFFRAIAERLDRPLPQALAEIEANRNDASEPREDLLTPESRRRLAQVFAADYDWLNEEP